MLHAKYISIFKDPPWWDYGQGEKPRSDCDEGAGTLAEGSAHPIETVEHPYLASIENSSGISQ